MEWRSPVELQLFINENKNQSTIIYTNHFSYNSISNRKLNHQLLLINSSLVGWTAASTANVAKINRENNSIRPLY